MTTLDLPTMLDVAVKLAQSAHAGQLDKLGVDYISHPLEVMHRVATTDEKTWQCCTTRWKIRT
jgi:(p)ppGpp synthase/HD superfamily hydrolase